MADDRTFCSFEQSRYGLTEEDELTNVVERIAINQSCPEDMDDGPVEIVWYASGYQDEPPFPQIRALEAGWSMLSDTMRVLAPLIGSNPPPAAVMAALAAAGYRDVTPRD